MCWLQGLAEPSKRAHSKASGKLLNDGRRRAVAGRAERTEDATPRLKLACGLQVDF